MYFICKDLFKRPFLCHLHIIELPKKPVTVCAKTFLEDPFFDVIFRSLNSQKGQKLKKGPPKTVG